MKRLNHETTSGPKISALMTVSDVAERLRISVSLVYQMVESGKLPVIRIGNGRGAVRFTNEDIDSYINSHRVVAISPQSPTIRPHLKHIRIRKSGT
jgi:excisionase family DNA binding protein